MTFSIIIPVYNSEDYLKACLDSVKNQTYTSFEVIIINDGSKDKSEDIIKEYVKEDKRFKYFRQDNQGISITRNTGVTKSKGEYLLFLDSDDYLKEDTLEKLFSIIEKYPKIDLIKYQLETLKDNKRKVYENPIFEPINGEEAFIKLIKTEMFVTPVTYVYNRDFWIKNKFLFASKRIHEDFGLIPYVVLKAKSICSISYTGYTYVIHENSIMTNNSLEKIKKKNEDILFHFDNLLNMVNKDLEVSLESKKIFQSYLTNALINRAYVLKGDILKNFLKEIKKRKAGSYLLEDNFLRKIKKKMFSFFPRIYIYLFRK